MLRLDHLDWLDRPELAFIKVAAGVRAIGFLERACTARWILVEYGYATLGWIDAPDVHMVGRALAVADEIPRHGTCQCSERHRGHTPADLREAAAGGGRLRIEKTALGSRNFDRAEGALIDRADRVEQPLAGNEDTRGGCRNAAVHGAGALRRGAGEVGPQRR